MPGTPVPIRLDEFFPDAQEIGLGVIVNQPGWQQTIEDNKQGFLNNFVRRNRFALTYPASMTPDSFVDALFANSGVIPTSAERQAAIAEFAGAP